jgi:secreted trypsin-like serine protease
LLRLKPTLIPSLALLTFAAACGAPQDSAETTSDVNIVGGRKVDANQTDARRVSTVALTTDVARRPGEASLLSKGTSFCTGTIIGVRTILTAAHCVQEFEPRSGQKKGLLLPKESDFLVYFGTQVRNDTSFARAKRVIPHPEWDPKTTLQPSPRSAPNDIAIIVLEDDIPDGYAPVRVADPSLDLARSKVALAGFGVPFSRAAGNTGTLRQIDVRINRVDARAKRLSISGGVLRGACAGDSGGPAFVEVDGEMQVVGATSTGAEILTACIGIINNFTDARQYAKWIASVER